MALFADGGVLATKPYAASAKYVGRMSDYCRGCRFDVDKATGSNACPFNFLYWNFLSEHRVKLAGNPRMAMIYQTLDWMPPKRVASMKTKAERFLDRVS